MRSRKMRSKTDRRCESRRRRSSRRSNNSGDGFAAMPIERVMMAVMVMATIWTGRDE
jgi:hypothetical protein